MWYIFLTKRRHTLLKLKDMKGWPMLKKLQSKLLLNSSLNPCNIKKKSKILKNLKLKRKRLKPWKKVSFRLQHQPHFSIFTTNYNSLWNIKGIILPKIVNRPSSLTSLYPYTPVSRLNKLLWLLLTTQMVTLS